jgi:lipase chaperone LimK
MNEGIETLGVTATAYFGRLTRAALIGERAKVETARRVAEMVRKKIAWQHW